MRSCSASQLKGPGVGLTDVLRATEYVVPAIEIVDARLINPRKIFDTISDNGAAAGIVVGGRPVGPDGRRPALGRRPDDAQLRDRGDRRRGRRARSSGDGGRLARQQARHPRDALEPGHLVLAGSFTRVVWAQKGDTIRADFGSLGSISLQFV